MSLLTKGEAVETAHDMLLRVNTLQRRVGGYAQMTDHGHARFTVVEEAVSIVLVFNGEFFIVQTDHWRERHAARGGQYPAPREAAPYLTWDLRDALRKFETHYFTIAAPQLNPTGANA